MPVTLTMLSDWHIGSGAGTPGRVQAGVQRDMDGLPYVPASTFAGVWRDACESVVFALDGGCQEDWHAWLEFLFGSQPSQETRRGVPLMRIGAPRPAALVVDSLHFPSSVRRALRDKPSLVAAAVFLKPGVKVDAGSGRAEDGTLRYEEMARGGTALTGQVQVSTEADLDEEQLYCAAALLDASARLLEGVGHRRRRGAGRCRLMVGSLPANWQWLRQHRVPPAVPSVTEGTAPRGLPTPAADRDQARWEVADLRMLLRRPVIAHQRKVGNEVRSLDYVPGRLMLPAVLRSLSSPGAAMAARAGDLVITDATVEVDGGAGEPAPLALVREKNDPVVRQFNLMTEAVPEGVQTVPFDNEFLGPYRPGAPLSAVTCETAEYTHNVISDLEQRPVRDIGGLFTYQAIAAGTVLRAQVRVRSGILEPGWQKRLTGRWRLGMARRGGYGLTEVTAGELPVPAPRPLPSARGQLRVRLLSDVLVNDERLRPSTSPAHLAAELGRALGVTLRPADEEVAERPVRVSERRRSDSWHSKWGLPRASMLGMRGGSCLTCDVVDGVVTAEAVSRVELSGIGLRRAEGYGQVRIADALLEAAFGERGGAGCGTDRGSKDDLDDTAPAPIGAGETGTEESGDCDGTLLVLEDAAWRTWIQHACETLASSAAGRAQAIGSGYEEVPQAQLGTLRMLAGQVRAPEEPRTMAWLRGLDRLQGVSSERRGPWPKKTVDHLRRMLTDSDEVWACLGLPKEQSRLLTHPDRADGMKKRLWAHAVRTLLDDCLTAHTRAAETGEGV
ncbi:RAMP superfamily CRISPR-associated protein [Streptomyces sp. TS71-3]|uniref:RAMP superfamily CRISPR-associated protein n=1 Tax=Streptomyces sp. TS71-3 TaxID=2733862 RepID=UPI001BB3675A|nr:RAMP superfamily CRISPR-associated protein [Streptomyces sp. TS71-3]